MAQAVKISDYELLALKVVAMSMNYSEDQLQYFLNMVKSVTKLGNNTPQELITLITKIVTADRIEMLREIINDCVIYGIMAYRVTPIDNDTTISAPKLAIVYVKDMKTDEEDLYLIEFF